MRSVMASFALTKSPVISDYEAADVTCFSVLTSTWIGALWKRTWFPIGILESILLPRKWCPPTLLLLLDTNMHEESDATCNITSERLNVVN